MCETFLGISSTLLIVMCYPRNLALSAAFPSKVLLDRLARVNTRPVEGSHSQTCLRTGLAPPSALVSPHPTVTGSWCLLRSVSPTYANGRHTVVTDPIASSSGSMSLLVLHHRGVAKKQTDMGQNQLYNIVENGSLVPFATMSSNDESSNCGSADISSRHEIFLEYSRNKAMLVSTGPKDVT